MLADLPNLSSSLLANILSLTAAANSCYNVINTKIKERKNEGNLTDLHCGNSRAAALQPL